MHQLHRTWLYFICACEALPCPSGLQWLALEKCKVFCGSRRLQSGWVQDQFDLGSPLGTPVFAQHRSSSSAGATLSTVVADVSHTLDLLALLVPSLCSSGLQTPFISLCHTLQIACFHLLSACGQLHPNCSLRSPFAAGHVASRVAVGTLSHPTPCQQ